MIPTQIGAMPLFFSIISHVLGNSSGDKLTDISVSLLNIQLGMLGVFEIRIHSNRHFSILYFIAN